MGSIDWGKVIRDGDGDKKRPRSGRDILGKPPEDMKAFVTSVISQDAASRAEDRASASTVLNISSTVQVLNLLTAAGTITKEQAAKLLENDFDILQAHLRTLREDAVRDATEAPEKVEVPPMLKDEPGIKTKLSDLMVAGTNKYYDSRDEAVAKAKGEVMEMLASGEELDPAKISAAIHTALNASHGMIRSIVMELLDASGDGRLPSGSVYAKGRVKLDKTFQSGRVSSGTIVPARDMNIGATYGRETDNFINHSAIFPCHVQVAARVNDDELKGFMDAWSKEDGGK